MFGEIDQTYGGNLVRDSKGQFGRLNLLGASGPKCARKSFWSFVKSAELVVTIDPEVFDPISLENILRLIKILAYTCPSERREQLEFYLHGRHFLRAPISPSARGHSLAR